MLAAQDPKHPMQTRLQTLTATNLWRQLRTGVLVLVMLIGMVACQDSVETVYDNMPLGQVPYTRTLRLDLNMNQSRAISLADSLDLGRTFRQEIGRSRLGRFVQRADSPVYDFIPNQDSIGAEWVFYTICFDTQCVTDSIWLRITDPSNCRLEARADVLIVTDGDRATLDLAANDDTCAGVRYQLITPTIAGTFSLSPKGILEFEALNPPPTTIDLRYRITAPGKAAREADINILHDLGCYPQPSHDNFLALAGQQRDIQLLANDQLCANTTVEIVNQPRGTLVNMGGGRFRYLFNGLVSIPQQDNFTYRLRRGIYASGEAQVTMRVFGPCTSFIPSFINYDWEAGRDTFFIRRINHQQLRICDHERITITSVNVRNTGIYYQAFPDGKCTFDLSNMTANTGLITINYRVEDQIGNTPPRNSIVHLTVQKPLCRGTVQAPTIRETDATGNNAGVVIDLSTLMPNLGLQCLANVSATPPAVNWRVPVGFNVQYLNAARTQVRITRTVGGLASGSFIWEMSLVDNNLNPIGLLTGQAIVTIY